jgi:predicted DsbA family dithiol-disulfide isomerase
MILDIDFVSDFVCPWCFLGRMRLVRAVEQVGAQRPDLTLRVNWLPFFLNPDTPAGGEPYRPFLEAKFGGAREADAVQARVAEAGALDGVHFAFERIALRPNTLKAHRLSYRAQSLGYTGAQVSALGEALFAAHFQEGRNIGDDATLAAIAAATCGDRKEDVIAYLESGQDEATVKRMAVQIQKQGINGVPFFIVNRKLTVSGAQTPAVLGAAILQAIR